MEQQVATRAARQQSTEYSWEGQLDSIKAELWDERTPVETQLLLIIAEQLRELITAVRPLLKHPLLRR